MNYAVYFRGDVVWLTDQDYERLRRCVGSDQIRDATEQEKQAWRDRCFENLNELADMARKIGNATS